jgi:hypothetical protein
MAERFVECVYCHKKLFEGVKAYRRRGWTGFYCSPECITRECLNIEFKEITDELVREDEECLGFGWNS